MTEVHPAPATSNRSRCLSSRLAALSALLLIGVAPAALAPTPAAAACPDGGNGAGTFGGLGCGAGGFGGAGGGYDQGGAGVGGGGSGGSAGTVSGNSGGGGGGAGSGGGGGTGTDFGSAGGADGGAGGYETGSYGSGGGGGGGGRSGLELATGGTISLSATGGNGGNGDNGQAVGVASGGGGGGGGGGGYGAVLSGTSAAPKAFTLLSGYAFQGGRGGNGGAAGISGAYPQGGGGGGAGAAGALLSYSTLTVQNGASVTGGNGGAGGSGGTGGPSGGMGAGGAGISASNATVIVGGIVSGGMSGDGATRANAITFTDGTNRLELWAGATINGTVDASASSNSTLAFGGHENGNFDLSQIGIAAQYRGFQTFEKSGSGIWTFTGTSLDPLQWTVGSGKLVVNGSGASPVTVNAGATLGGSGTVGSTTIASGGTITPGNSIGTLTVVGNYTQKAGSAYDVETDPDGRSDLIDVTGKAKIEGGTVFASMAPGDYYGVGTRYTILKAAGGVTGRFDALDQNAPLLFVDFSLAYDLNAIYLDVVRNSILFCDVAATRNQCAASAGAEGLSSGNPLYGAITAMTDIATARAAFDQLSGEVHASAKTALIEDSRFVRDAANARIRAAFDGVGAVALPVMAYGEVGSELAPATTERLAVWGEGFGSWGQTRSDDNTADLNRSVGGFLIGGDAALDEAWRLGVVTGYSHDSFHVDDRASSGSSDNIHLGLYGGGQWGAFGVRGGAAYSWNRIETARNIAFPGLVDSLTATYDAGTAQVFGEAGYRIDTAGAAFEPFANLAYVSLHSDGFTETGGAAALAGAAATTDATFATLGVRAASDFALGGVEATARGMIGWRHAFGDTAPLSNLAFAGGDSFAITGAPIARDAAVIEAGLDFQLTPQATLGLSYSGQLASRAHDNGFKLDLSVRF